MSKRNHNKRTNKHFQNVLLDNEISYHARKKTNNQNINLWKKFNSHFGYILSQYSNVLTTSHSFQTKSQQFVDTPIATSVYVKQITNGEVF